MASDAIRGFWNAGANAERERVLLRISQGTKGSSPVIRSKHRLNPLYYSNPLPDNSSGSKIRPFDGAKDESGRPNAMEKVAMRQRGELPLKGGVVKDYRYARKILDRRARDTTNLALESQGLPRQAEPITTLTESESKNIELNQLLQNIQNQIELGGITQLTINEMKGIPRLLISLIPSYSPDEATALLQFIDDDILNVLNDVPSTTKLTSTVESFFEDIRQFIVSMMPVMNADEATKSAAASTLGKRIFGTLPATVRRPQATLQAPSAQELQNQLEALTEGREAPATPERAPSPPMPELMAPRAPGVSPAETARLRQAYRDNDLDTLESFINRRLPTIRADKWFKSRTTMANLITSKLGINIRPT